MEATMWAAVAAGFAAAVMCVLFYAKGVRDGRGDRKGRRRARPLPTRGAEETAMGRKYEAILSYDPYAPKTNVDNKGGEA